VDGELSADVRHFLTNHIVSVEELELLLVLYRERGRDWSAPELTSQLRSQNASIERWLGILQSLGLAAENGGRWRFAAASEALETQVAAVAAAYQERWTKVIEFIYFKPNEKLLSFTRAFDLRKRP
jgi:hypothetical protein